MAYQLSRRTVVLAKTEASEGVDASPSASTDAMLLFGNMNPFSLDTRIVTKDVVRDSLTNNKDLVGRQLANLTLETVLMSRGNAGGVPFFDPLIKACGFSVSSGGTAAQSSSWIYSPVSTSFSTASIYTYLDGILTKSLGCLGTMSLSMTAGESPDLSFTMQGTYNNPTAVALPTPTYPTDTKSMVQSAALSIGAYNAAAGLVARSISLDWGASNTERGDVNSTYGFKGLALTARTPTLTIVCECEDNVDKNFFTYLNSTQVAAADGSMDNITFSHGDGTQSKINFTVRAPMLTGIELGDDNGIRTYTLNYKLRNNTSNNEFTMEFVEKL